MLAISARNDAAPTSSSGTTTARPAVAVTVGSRAASRRCPSVWPSGISRTPLEIGIGGERLQVGAERRLERQAMPRARHRHRNRQRDFAIPDRTQSLERRRRPGCAGGIEKGTTLSGRFEVALLRGSECGGKLGDRAQRRVVARGGRAMGVCEENCIAKSGAIGDHDGEPPLEGSGIADVAGGDGPLNSAGIGECAGRIGR